MAKVHTKSIVTLLKAPDVNTTSQIAPQQTVTGISGVLGMGMSKRRMNL